MPIPVVASAPPIPPDTSGPWGPPDPSTRPAKRWRIKAAPLAMTVVLAGQAYMSARLVWSNTAFVDEATYLYAGHQEIHSLFANGSLTVPGQNGYYQAYFSGAPALYPILGAIADSLGGLVAARVLSLMFMLGATTLLYLTTGRLYGRCAAVCASAAFAVLGPTQFLGAFATYDAMALCLMALAAFLAVKSAQESDNVLTLFYACLVMILADATKYAVILFDPVIIGLCVLTSVPYRGWPQARRHGYRMLGYSATLAAAVVAIGGHTYIEGLMSTTIARTHGEFPAIHVLTDSWRWVGSVAVIALIGTIFQLGREHRASKLLSALLTIAVLLVPLNQARIHTATSLQKHVDFGAWFAAVIAGYAIAKVIPARNRVLKLLSLPAAAVVLVAVSTITMTQATVLFQSWKNSTRQVAALRPWVKNENVLAEDYFIYSYYLAGEVSLQRWGNTWHLSYQDPLTHRTLTGPSAYLDAIRHHYFGTIALSYGTTSAIDHQIFQDMTIAGGYRRVEHVRYGHLWFDVFHDIRAR